MSRLTAQPDLSKYERVEPVSAGVQHQVPTPQDSGYSSTLICPMPLVSAAPDGLRQFYRSGIPQYRLIPPGRAIRDPLT